jgi:PD-(D/E)XK nuclease superfamily
MNTDRMLEVPNEKQFPDKEVAQRIIGSVFEVSNHLGQGYLEKVYQRAMQAESVSIRVHLWREPFDLWRKGVDETLRLALQRSC